MKKWLEILMLGLLLATQALAQTPSDKKANPVDLKQIDTLLQKEYPANAPGAAVIIKKQGATILRKGYGMADLELGVPMAPDMVFRLGSMTKQFTAVAILMLAEQGKLNLEDTLDKYMPDFPTQGKRITIEQLLTHTAGIKEVTELPEWLKMWRKDMTVQELLNLFKPLPLDFDPGTKWNYSNSGYIILGAIIEKVAGVSYEEFINTRIFKPLGMTHSCYGSATRVIPRRIPGYTLGNDKIYINAEYLSMTQPYAAGSILSNVDDLAAWDEALQAGKLIKPESLRRAWTPLVLPNGDSTAYGYGWRISSYEGHRMIEHGGSIHGFLTYALSLPEDRVYIAILHNCGDKSASGLAFRLATLVLGKPVVKPSAIAVPVDELQSLCGHYEHGADDIRVITLENGKLYSQRGGGPRYDLIPVAENEFAISDTTDRLVAVRDATGKVTEVIAKPRLGLPDHGKRLERKPEERKTIVLEPAIFDRLVGEYELAPSFIITIYREGSRFMAQVTGQGVFEIFAESETRFFLKAVPAQVEFKLGADGKAESLVLNQGGQAMPAKKIR
jgi:CubicO group peptidase (beta-lactamase class C family)